MNVETFKNLCASAHIDDTISMLELHKNQMANYVILAHPVIGAPLVLYVDAPNSAIGAALHQVVNGVNQPLGFFSKRLTDTEMRYSTYDRELLAAFRGVKHFNHILEGQQFILFTDHKPLTIAFKQKLDKASPRQINHLNYISQFTTQIHHVSGANNIAADFLSRIEVDEVSLSDVDYFKTARFQANSTELDEIKNSSSLEFKQSFLNDCNSKLFCDVSTGRIRPFTPKECRQNVFDSVHNLAHTGIRSTLKSISERFVWPSMRLDVKSRVLNCLHCQRCKIQKHNRSKVLIGIQPNQRFDHINIDIVGPPWKLSILTDNY